MKKRTFVLFSFLLCILSSVYAQDYSVVALTIPDELRTDANAVVRDRTQHVVIESIDKVVTKDRYVVTILNKLGHERFTNTATNYDPDTRIRSISAKFYNALGKEIKKYSKNKFTDVSAVSNGSLYEDDRMLYVEYTPVAYPFTLVYEVEKVSRTTGFIPRWVPQRSFYLGVEKSTYRLENKTQSEIRTKEKNFEGFAITKKELANGFEYQAENLPPITFESMSVGIRSLTPQVLIAMNEFALKGVEGKANNWKEYGKWMYEELVKGRDELDLATKSQVMELVKDADGPLEKAKLIYKFMQEKTRYISVQVGIGGWEPIAANQVDKVGYGDCKGLSNYMKALLDAVGVESYYTMVYGGYKRSIENDFAMMQGNHAILNVPIDGKDYWLECTNQIAPFGFLGDFTDDRDVMIVTPEGGFIKHTSSYTPEDNLQKVNAEIVLEANGNVKAKVERISKGIQYSDKYQWASQPESELKKYYINRVWSDLNNLKLLDISIENNTDSVVYKEKFDLAVEGYATIMNNDYLFKVNMFNKDLQVPKRYRNRKQPFKLSTGYVDVDQYTIKIPEGYQISSLPAPKIIESKYGSYQVTFEKIDDQTIRYQKTIKSITGEFPKEEYNTYRKYRKSIARYENLRIALTKK